MTPTQSIILAVVSAVVGALLARYVPTKKSDAETQKLIHDTNSNDLVISDKMLEKWIKIASDAEEKVAQLRQDKADENIGKKETEMALKEVEGELRECRESLEKCREKHGCSEG